MSLQDLRKEVLIVAKCIVNKLKEVIQEADPNVFILITDAQEVIGQGFTQPIVPAEISNQLKSQDITTEANNHVVTDENSCNR